MWGRGILLKQQTEFKNDQHILKQVFNQIKVNLPMCLFYKMYLQKYLITYKRYKNKYKIYMFTYCLYIHYLHIQNYRLFVHDSQCLTSTETTKTNTAHTV